MGTDVDWQFSSSVAVAKKAYDSVTVYLTYHYNVNTVYFDGVQVFKEQFSSSYAYDDNNNITSVTDLLKQKTTYTYNSDNELTKEVLPTGLTRTYTYDDYHNVIKIITKEGTTSVRTDHFVYDTYGNITEERTNVYNVPTPAVKTTYTYSADGNRLTSMTDSTGKTTNYQYNANTNTLTWVRYPGDTEATRTNYTYDSILRLTKAASATDTGLSLSAGYTYDANDYLTKLTTPTTVYNFTYGDFGLRSAVKVGTATLAEYSYTNDRNKYLNRLDYGNGDSVQYTYDDLGRQVGQTYEDGAKVTYKYDNNGALAKVKDTASGITTTYYYDLIDRLARYTETATGLSHTVTNTYNTLNQLTKVNETVGGTTYATTYTYDAHSRVSAVTSGGVKKTYTYDAIGRNTQQVVSNGDTTVRTDTFTFRAPSTDTLSAQISKHTIAATSYNKSFTYTYDGNGNILSISDGSKTVTYVYDTANQLVRANDPYANKTTTWTYDNGGNIKKRTEYAYTTGTLGTATATVNYTYGNSNWGDLLTSYNGQTITYDEIGNPLSDGTNTYTWKHGRQLATLNNGTKTWTYTYNSDGLRTKRATDTATYTYVYNGDKLTYMTVGSNKLYFGYDASGTPMRITYNGTVYYYVTNLQDDVIAILNSSGTAVVQYTYDAWGNPVSTTGSMATTLGATNPLRYRSYVYDQETNLYYLQSRYYNPKTGRFLNADAFAATGQDTLGNNMFTYCLNNPIAFTDQTGELAYPGEIHQQVVDRISRRYSYNAEQWILYQYGGWGRADLISNTGQVWDVKPNKPYHISAGKRQVDRYVAGLWARNPTQKLSVGGDTIEPAMFYHKSGYVTYKVRYQYEDHGVITYDYRPTDFDYKQATSDVLAVAASVLTLYLINLCTAVAVA